MGGALLLGDLALGRRRHGLDAASRGNRVADLLVLRANLGEQERAMLTNWRAGSRRCRHSSADGVGSRLDGRDSRVDGRSLG